jgi:hypothetical protein
MSNLPQTISPLNRVHLGEIQPTEAETMDWVKKLVNERRHAIMSGALPVPPDVNGSLSIPATQEEYLLGVRQHKKIMKEYDGWNYSATSGALQVAASYRPKYTPDHLGYMKYLNDYFHTIKMDNEFQAAMNAMPRPILDETAREGHTSIVGGSNTGKSELMKALAYHDIRRGESSVIIIDPHGDMAQQIARWPEVAKSGRLVLFGNPHEGKTARFNPVDGQGLSQDEKEKVAQMLVAALGDLVDGAEPTPRMFTMAAQCVRVLLEAKGATLWELQDMLTQTNAAQWVARGKQHPSPNVAKYFKNEFADTDKNSSRNGLRDRLWHFLSSDDFTARFCQPSTVDLVKEIDARKVIIFDLSGLVERPRMAAGRLIMGTLAGIAMRRIARTLPRSVPVHVYLDEASTMLGGAARTILQEARKARFFLTLAQHSPNGVDFLLRDKTAVRFAGGTGWQHALAGTSAALNKTDKNTPKGTFWVNWAGQPPVRLTVRSDLAGDKYGIPRDEWKKIEAQQRAQYYKPTIQPQEVQQAQKPTFNPRDFKPD